MNSAFYVWVNGRKVGFNQGSHMPAEFEISTLTRPGRNMVAVEVYSGVPAVALKTRTCGAWRGSSATCLCIRPLRCTYATSQ
ncbi:MAG: hypothetical protein KBB15_10145 [Firmicutes bacterium]|nr:hypothetical protein [Bacillota bacterium]